MKLKRHFKGEDPNRTDEEAEQFKQQLRATRTPRVTHVDVLQHSKKWRPSTKIIRRGVAEGWLTRDGAKITLITAPDDPDLVYNIVAGPGTYCCHCGDPIADSKTALAHVKKEHKGKKSPSARNPSGYAVHRFFMCELEAS